MIHVTGKVLLPSVKATLSLRITMVVESKQQKQTHIFKLVIMP